MAVTSRAVLTTVLWIVLSFGLRVYLGVAADADRVLGVLGFFILVLWLYILGLGLLLGGELNPSSRRSRWRATAAATAGTTDAARPTTSVAGHEDQPFAVGRDAHAGAGRVAGRTFVAEN